MRRTSRLVVLAALMSLFVTAGGSSSQAAEGGSLHGQIVMGTKGSPIPPDLQLQLVALAADGGEVFRKQTTAAPDGAFTFEGLGETPPNRYLIGVPYKGVAYTTTVVPSPNDTTVSLPIFDTTTDTSVVVISSDTLTMLEGKNATVEVLQLLKVQNRSDRSYIGVGDDQKAESGPGGRRVLKLPVPEGAFSIAPSDPGNTQALVNDTGGLAATRPLVPGETLVSYVYKVKFPRSGWQLRKRVEYPTEHEDLLVGPGLQLKAASGFSYVEQRKLGKTLYRRYRSSAYAPGGEIGADVIPLSKGAPSVWIGFAAAAAVLTAIGLGALLKIRGNHARPIAAGGDPQADERDRLIEQIAVLDEQFESGSLAEEMYRKRRDTMKDRLAALSR